MFFLVGTDFSCNEKTNGQCLYKGGEKICFTIFYPNIILAFCMIFPFGNVKKE